MRDLIGGEFLHVSGGGSSSKKGDSSSKKGDSSSKKGSESGPSGGGLVIGAIAAVAALGLGIIIKRRGGGEGPVDPE